MKTFFFLIIVTMIVIHGLISRKKPLRRHKSVDAIVPAYNEATCIEASLEFLLKNPYINNVICVNDGSVDNTQAVLLAMARKWDNLIVVNQENTGKGGALMNGLNHVTTEQVFLTDADTYIPIDDGIGYLLAEIDGGADAVGGIPSSNLSQAGLLPHIRATVKFPMIAIKRTLQQWLGGAPFIISGSCGMFRVSVLKNIGFSDRTKVEDLDLTWSLIANKYKVKQTNRCVVYPQECNSLSDEWKRWRRWIAGYAVCMKLHKNLLFTRYGIFSILPMFLVILYAMFSYFAMFTYSTLSSFDYVFIFFPLFWILIVSLIASFSAYFHRNWKLIPLASFAIFYVFLAYVIWITYGIKAFFTGKEPTRDKPTRYKNMVGRIK